jgi:hypothetical protein
MRPKCEHIVSGIGLGRDIEVVCGKPAIEYDEPLGWWLCAEHWDEWMKQLQQREFEGLE